MITKRSSMSSKELIFRKDEKMNSKSYLKNKEKEVGTSMVVSMLKDTEFLVSEVCRDVILANDQKMPSLFFPSGETIKTAISKEKLAELKMPEGIVFYESPFIGPCLEVDGLEKIRLEFF